jgi:hypothetical protein
MILGWLSHRVLKTRLGSGVYFELRDWTIMLSLGAYAMVSLLGYSPLEDPPLFMLFLLFVSCNALARDIENIKEKK